MAFLILMLPRKFFEMDYYYLVILPPLCILAGLGWDMFFKSLRPSRMAILGLVALAVFFSLRYAIKPAFVSPDEDRMVLETAEAVQRLTALEEPVVTMHGSAVNLLYYCNRPGWVVESEDPVLDDLLQRCHQQGARLLVVTGKDAQNPRWGAPIAKGGDYCVFLLAGKNAP